jgi:hypothetical protein
MSNAEVMTFAIITTKFFLGNFKMARYTQVNSKIGIWAASKPLGWRI